MRKIEKGLFKIISICVGICLFLTTSAYSLPMLRTNSLFDVINLPGEKDRTDDALDTEIIGLLLSDVPDIEERKRWMDRGLDLLDTLDEPDRIVTIVKEIFTKRNLELEISPVYKNSIGDIGGDIKIIRTQDGSCIAQRNFYTLTSLHGDTLLFSYGQFNTDFTNEFAGKRLFPLLYRWMSANPYFSKYSGWAIKLDDASYGAAKAWWRSGFPVKITSIRTGREITSIEEITNEDGNYKIEGTFLAWKDKKPQPTPNEPVEEDVDTNDDEFIRVEFSNGQIDIGSIGESEIIFPTTNFTDTGTLFPVSDSEPDIIKFIKSLGILDLSVALDDLVLNAIEHQLGLPDTVNMKIEQFKNGTILEITVNQPSSSKDARDGLDINKEGFDLQGPDYLIDIQERMKASAFVRHGGAFLVLGDLIRFNSACLVYKIGKKEPFPIETNFYISTERLSLNKVKQVIPSKDSQRGL